MNIFQILSSIFMFLCSTVGVICSLIFIGVVAIDRRYCTPIILIGLNTVFAGCIVNIIYASQAIHQIISDSSDALCVFRGFLLHSSTGLFYHTLCIQAFYRLFVTIFAQKRYLQSARVIIPIVIIQWIISGTFAIPILLLDRIKFQADGRICQVSINDIFSFVYLASFIYFVPITIIIFIYISLLKYMKRNIIIAGVRQHAIEQTRRQRDLRFMQRILILVIVLFLTSFPYVSFFFYVNISHLPLPSYGHRVSFMFLAFGQSVVMVLTVIYTEEVRKTLLNTLGKIFPCIRTTRVQDVNTVNVPLGAVGTTAM